MSEKSLQIISKPFFQHPGEIIGTINSDKIQQFVEWFNRINKKPGFLTEQDLNDTRIKVCYNRKRTTRSHTGWTKVQTDHADICYIIFKKTDSGFYYFERIGKIQWFCTESIEPYAHIFNKELWRIVKKSKSLAGKIVPTTITERVNNYYDEYCRKIDADNIDYIEEYNSINPEEPVDISTINFNHSYIERLKAFDEIQEIDSDYKLKTFDENIHTSTNKNGISISEGEYNDDVSKKDGYYNLDKICVDGVEIADVYDSKNNILYHNKRHGADLRVLAAQIDNGACSIKNKEQYVKYHDILKSKGIDITINPDTIIYVAGIITKNPDKPLSDQLRLFFGMVALNLKTQGVPLKKDTIKIIPKKIDPK